MRNIASAALASRAIRRSAGHRISSAHRDPSMLFRHQISSKAESIEGGAAQTKDLARPGDSLVESSRSKDKKTMAQLDEELRLRMSGDGGAAGVEYENGRAEGLKSEVKRNMFRII
ncbi:unnamed protein product [Clonostachys rosea f. rosea IK726]|uniref:Uncharacterized protein n=1 Tax=Clonostachys rosea f. rosea IK726 TaxID=1349383 RepID=A0ACA9U2C8_BIOOC|nr:unnamed protein product [Clonostachys rosea f. rosea IK726]